MATRQAPETATAPAGNGARAPGESFDVHNPADGSVIATLPIDDRERVSEIVARVRANQPAWEALGIKGRRRWLDQLRDWMLDHSDEIADLMQAETGKVRADAAGESVYLTDLINFYGRKARRFIGDEKVPAHSPLMKVKRLRVQYRPYPVAGIISPWNFPLILSIGDAIPALMAGCAVVIKPSEVTPLAVDRLLRAWKQELGAPDVFEVVNGRGETGSALVDQVDFVQFTGSDRTGKKVMAQAAEQAHARQPGARRQRPDDRAALRRPRAQRQRRRLGRLPELRPGLHVGGAPLRRGARLRRVRAAPHR